MKRLFSRAGRVAMDALPRKKTLFAFDFDGTLAPIVVEPDDAFTLKSLRSLLNRLDAESTTAVISGRAVRDVKARLRFDTDYVIGNHGLEGLREFSAKAARARAICRKWVAALKRDLKELPEGHGIFIEDKGHSLSLHYRQAPDPKKAARWLQDEVDNLWPSPRLIGGKYIFNIIPQNSPHKGTALKALMKKAGCTHAVFVGDDVTDEDAFAQKGKILSIRVGRKNSSRAQFYIKDQSEMAAMINEFLKRLA